MSENNSYLGNPHLKGTNVSVEYTPEQVEEYIKCAKDPMYFIEKYIKIVNVDEGLTDINLYGFQKRIIEAIHNNRFVVCKIPRQSGKTTCTMAYLLHYCLFNADVRVAILANKLGTAREILDRFKLAYENLPYWLQQGVKEWNKLSVKLENNATIITAATSSSAVRGGSFNCVTGDTIVEILHDGRYYKLPIKNVESLYTGMPIHPELSTSEYNPISNKYYRWYQNLITKAESRVELVEGELHHIQPRSLGGTEDAGNKVQLTHREHYLAHRLLVKFLTGKHKAKMVCAWHRMVHGRQNQYFKISSRQYAVLKQEYSKSLVLLRTGTKHSEITKQKIAASNKGKVLSQHTKDLISEANTGRHLGKLMPPEHGDKISKALLGHKKTPDHVTKINNNPEKIRKTAEKHRGMKRSDATKKKMSEAKKGKPAHNKGTKNPNYAHRWYYNPTTNHVIRVLPENAPEGYVLGKKAKLSQ